VPGRGQDAGSGVALDVHGVSVLDRSVYVKPRCREATGK
jgi:hypothetical protein